MVRPMVFFLLFLGLLAVAGVGVVGYVRYAPSDAARWHVDPVTAVDPTTPNFARVDRVVAMPPGAVAEGIAARARAEGAERLAGDDGFATWIARTPRMRFPDYVSIRLIPEGQGTRIVAFSRSRFGVGDHGVNRARLQRWLPQ